MGDRIEVYIKNENVVISQGIIRPLVDHGCTDGMTGKTEKVMPESDRLVLDALMEFANERELDVVVHDVHTFKGRLKAMLNGVSKTPTIVIGKLRIEGELAPELLRSKLELALKK
jgi:hypothetical protein